MYSDVEVISIFFSRIFGAISGFFLYVFENVEIYGLNILEILFMMLVIALLIMFVKVVL